MQFDRTLLAEYDLPMRTPDAGEEMLTWAKAMTDPANNAVGFYVSMQEPGWT